MGRVLGGQVKLWKSAKTHMRALIIPTGVQIMQVIIRAYLSIHRAMQQYFA
jgi:hypothetical protein